MVWSLLLAHFAADFPLQPAWMVQAKRHLWGLSLHVGIHFLVMLLVVGLARRAVWPYLLLITGLHFIIDLGKNEIQRLRPQWVVLPYLVDQGLHYLSIGIVAILIQNAVSISGLLLSKTASIYATGYLIVTYVWFITERIFSYSEPQYQEAVIDQFWQRMIGRAFLLTILLLGANLFGSGEGFNAAFVPIPYISGKNTLRAFLTDFAVAFSILIFIRLANQ